MLEGQTHRHTQTYTNGHTDIYRLTQRHTDIFIWRTNRHTQTDNNLYKDGQPDIYSKRRMSDRHITY